MGGGNSVAPCHFQGVVRGAPTGSVVALSRCPTKTLKTVKTSSAFGKRKSASTGRSTESTGDFGSLEDDEVGISGFIDDLSGDYYYIEPLKPGKTAV